MPTITSPEMLARVLARETGHQDTDYDRIFAACTRRHYAASRAEAAEHRADDAEAVARVADQAMHRVEFFLERVRGECSTALGIPGPTALPLEYVPTAIKLLVQEHQEQLQQACDVVTAIMRGEASLDELLPFLRGQRFGIWATPAPDNDTKTPHGWYDPPRVALFITARAAQAQADRCVVDNDRWRYEVRPYDGSGRRRMP